MVEQKWHGGFFAAFPYYKLSPVTFLYGLAEEKTSSVLPTLPDTSTKVEIILINESFYQEKID